MGQIHTGTCTSTYTYTYTYTHILVHRVTYVRIMCVYICSYIYICIYIYTYELQPRAQGLVITGYRVSASGFRT